MVASLSYSRKTRRLEDLQHARDEARVRWDFRRRIHRSERQQQISLAAGIRDLDLIDRMIDAGFTADTLPALSVAPIAVMAWASGSVSDDEARTALGAVCQLGLAAHPMAMERFQSWLDERPAAELMDLWTDLTRHQVLIQRASIRELRCNELLKQAEGVALASGGFLGLGRICATEADLLDQIRIAFK